MKRITISAVVIFIISLSFSQFGLADDQPASPPTWVLSNTPVTTQTYGDAKPANFYYYTSNGQATSAIQAALTYLPQNSAKQTLAMPFMGGTLDPNIGFSWAKNTLLAKPINQVSFEADFSWTHMAFEADAVRAVLYLPYKRDKIASTGSIPTRFDFSYLWNGVLVLNIPHQYSWSHAIYPSIGVIDNKIISATNNNQTGTIVSRYIGFNGSFATKYLPFDFTVNVYRFLDNTQVSGATLRKVTSYKLAIDYKIETGNKGFKPSIGIQRVIGGDLVQNIPIVTYTQAGLNLNWSY